MQPYRIVFTGHINEMTRPAGFPQQVTAEKMIGAESKAGVYKFIQEYFHNMMEYGAMGTMKPEYDGKIIDPETSIENSMMVPLHMFSHFTVAIQVLVGGMEQFEKGGSVN